MLCVKTILRPSLIEGIGLFTSEPISRGDLIWRRDFMFDYAYNLGEIEQYPAIAKYVFPANGQYVLCGDDARFINHSDNPNCTEYVAAGETRASRDIVAGEELTVDYRIYGEPLGFEPAPAPCDGSPAGGETAQAGSIRQDDSTAREAGAPDDLSSLRGEIDRLKERLAESERKRAEAIGLVERLTIAFHVFQRSGHGGARLVVAQWYAGDRQLPIPWESGACFRSWAAEVGIVNVNGAMRLATTQETPDVEG